MQWLNKSKRIITSRLKDGTEQEQWAKDRLEICRICVHNSENTLEKSRRERWLVWANKAGNWLMRKKVASDAICNICGCNLVLKTGEKEEECGLAEQGQEPKWKSILPKR